MRHVLAYKQRGAAALFAAIGLLGMLLASAFAIDLAQMYVAKRDLQNMANLAALDVARAAGGCLALGQDPGRQTVANQTALATIGRMGGQASWLKGNTVDLGITRINADASRSFQASNVPGEAFAFRVNMQRPMPTLVVPLYASDGVLTAQAAASMAPTASFNVSTFVASVDPTEASLLNNLLGEALGAPLALTVLSYEGLLSSSVPLLDVVDDLVGQTLNDVLTGPVDLPGLLRALADTLFDAGRFVASNAVDAIADVAPDQEVELLTAIGGSDQDSPQELLASLGGATVNVLDLVQGLVYQLGDPVLQLFPNISIPGLVNIGGVLELGGAPISGVGAALQDSLSRFVTTAATAQGQVDLDVGIALPLLGDLIQLALEIDVAETEAELTGIDCAGRGQPNHKVYVRARPSIVRISVNNSITNPLLSLPLPIVGGLVKVCWEGEVNLGSDSYVPLEFEGPFDPATPVSKPVSPSVGNSVSTALQGLLNDPLTRPRFCGDLGLLNLVLDLVLGTLSDVVDALVPILNALDGALLDPLLGLLGASVGGAHVSVMNVEMAPPVLIQAE